MAKINTIFSFTDEVSNPLKRMGNNIRNVTDELSGMSMKILGVNQAIQLLNAGINSIQRIGGIFGELVSEAGNSQAIISRLSVALGDVALAEEKFKDIQNFASVTPFDVEGTAQAYIMLKNAGMETDALLPTIRMIGDLAQGNNQAFNNMALNMMQIRASGKATAQDLKQFSTFGVPISQALKEIGREGDMSFNAVYQAMIHLTSEGGKFYNSMALGAQTLSGRMANLQDSIQQLKSAIGSTMLPVVQKWQAVFADFFENLKTWFNEVINNGGGLTSLFDGMYLKLNTLTATIINLGTVTTVVATIMATAWAVANWPITLAVVLIITLVRAMFDVTNSANEAQTAMTGFGNSCAQAGQTFGYVVGAIGGVIGGVMNTIYNMVATLYNLWGYVAEFMVNSISHPILSIKRLFVDLVNTIIQVLATITGPIDMILGLGFTEKLRNASNALENWKNDNLGADDLWHAQKMNLKEISGVKQSSVNASNMLGNIGAMFDRSFIQGANSSQNAKDSLGLKTDGSGALVVTDKTLIDIADDYRQLLAERASSKFNLQFSKITPSITVGDVTFTSNADYDAFVHTLVSEVEQMQDSSLYK